MTHSRTFNLQQIAKLTSSELNGDPTHQIHNVADLETATIEDASFLANPRYMQAMKNSKAGVIFIDAQAPRIPGKNYLIASNPSEAFQKLVDAFFPQRKSPSGFQGIHPTAVIHETAHLSKDVTVGPYAVIDEGVHIGSRTFIGAGCYIGPETSLGEDCIIHPHVTIRERCFVGNSVIIQPGAVIGSCGFGYITDKQGRHAKLNQVGNVHIEDNVEIGANTTLDRARFKSTQVGQGTKIDNLVQLGHGVEIGPCNLIVAQTGIAGSTKTGRCVVLAGQVAVAGHLYLEDGVVVAGKSGVSKSLKAGRYSGIPALPIEEYNRMSVYLRQIEKYVKQIQVHEARLETLSESRSHLI